MFADNNEATYRRNFVFFLIDAIMFSAALGMMGLNTLIPDFVRKLTDSEIIIGFSAYLFEIGFTLPQLLIARYIVRAERKKWWFIGPNIPVRFIMIVFAISAVYFGAGQPTAILIAFFICYGIAAFGDGLVGVPWMDLIGSSLNDQWRARMLGLSSAISSVLMLGIPALTAFVLSSPNLSFPNNYALIFGIAGLIFALSTIPVLFVRELPSGKAVEKLPELSEFLPSLGVVLREDKHFRNLIFLRFAAILMLMASPFYVGFATERLGLTSGEAVPNLILMQTIGGIFGSIAYTWLGARDNLLFLRLAVAGMLFVPLSAIVAGLWGVIPLYMGFFFFGLCGSNLGFSFQNWLLGYANHEQRPIYTGLYNTIPAFLSLTAPVIAGSIVQASGYEALFSVSAVMVIVSLLISLQLPNPQKQKREAALAQAL